MSDAFMNMRPYCFLAFEEYTRKKICRHFH